MLNRRKFLNSTVKTTGVALAMQSFAARGALAAVNDSHKKADDSDGGYGELAPIPSENTGEMLLALPAGFKYNAFGRTGTVMSDGRPTPPAHDGMSTFEDDDCKIRLVRNHELRSAPGVALDPARSYDATAGGGTTTLIIDPRTRLPIRDFISLSGTHTNCAGGRTPWDSWITCEETVVGLESGFAKPHGYVFEVPAKSNRTVVSLPIKAMGRFVHEAIAVDSQTGVVYLTEDSNPSGLYRYIPHRRKQLAAGGRLQMLAIKEQPNYDTRTGQQAQEPLRVTWVDIDDPDPANAESDSHAVYQQGAEKGGAIFTRLEGAWYGNGSIFFNSTDGGNQRLGQVWEYDPKGRAGGELTLIFESPNADVLDSPDNICVSPGGGLVLCEDGSGQEFLRGLTTKGRIFDFALNVVPGATGSEFAGATFSPDGETLFVNIQSPGITFAIWGPWEKGAL
jgi:uncharacterized protein